MLFESSTTLYPYSVIVAGRVNNEYKECEGHAPCVRRSQTNSIVGIRDDAVEPKQISECTRIARFRCTGSSEMYR
jgi:hypothetical protein